ncbi:molybdopterin-dependent oxidoreductase alpha subunit [Pseudoduganella lurida]|uniref:Molybdopterin-dependent oxidoreductase alpha subunit n=1 Tax=Pseudoduganella lurida TaxID=1036180 RepID=A0A562RJF1_9BURK|nr:FdhF/YdeP family oxidoreductase [Pseudoduganella lurida]TWI69199.1 molybdopterin-dependent oxidoreductase alpha subunit [Pseudoduganella lurida]
MKEELKVEDPTMPAGGWGSVKEVTNILLGQHVPIKDSRLLMKQNKPDGYACVSCAWAKPANPHPFEFCESGAKATAWETTSKQIGADFFERHTVTELEAWSDHDLEDLGRLTVPLRWDAASDRYRPIAWDAAFREIGATLQECARDKVVFYSSGRASLETSYMYQLFARMYGNNNLPDSSNMCHESTSVGLQKSIGVPVGTVNLNDFEHTDCIFFFGQNVGVNSPRMLHQLQEARKRGVQIITFNPLRERGLVSFTNPQSPLEMLTGAETAISTQYHQVKPGGDTAALMGLCKAVLAQDDEARAGGAQRVLDTAFLQEHTHGFDDFEQSVRDCTWGHIERESGLTRSAIEAAADVYCKSSAVMGVYGMGLTQHRHGVQNVTMLVNFLLLRGNIGKPGAGICPVRGHSNVQGQRTVGITEKPELAPLDKLKEQYGFEPPREKGMNTVEACEAMLAGQVEAYIGLGGNFIRAIPDTVRMEAAWRQLPLTVQISTKLNRNHIIHGKASYILPCLGRIEIDRQGGVPQSVSIEDSTAYMHGSRGMAEPAADTLLSEPAIVAALAKATLLPNPKVDWDGWVADYSTVRNAIAETYPKIFHEFNERMWTPGGFRKPLAAAERVWNTPSGKAEFFTPETLQGDPDTETGDPHALRLFTVRSDGQFNTTIYSNDDRFRGVTGSRMVLFMSPADIARHGLSNGDEVDLRTAVGVDAERSVAGLTVVPYDIPDGCVAGYYPECNPLIPLWHHAIDSKVPAAKSIDVLIRRSAVQ